MLPRPPLRGEDDVKMAAESITALLPHAERHGMTLILENHYKDGFWQFPEFAQKREVFLQLLDAIPRSPWLGVHTGYASILRHGVIGRGLNDYDAIFSTLARAGFRGWISIEDGDDPRVGMEHLRLSA